MSERRGIEADDWINAAFNLVIGVLLGFVAYHLLNLVAAGAWWMAMIIVLLGAGLFLFMFLSDKLFDLFLPSPIRPGRSPKPQRPKPLLRILSLPSGFILGLILAVLDLDRTILDFLP